MGGITIQNPSGAIQQIPNPINTATVTQVNQDPATPSGPTLILWGSIDGNILQQVDLQQQFALKAGTAQLNAHINDTNNPHQVTKDQVGLGNVENLSPADLAVAIAPTIGPLVSVTSSQISDASVSGRNVLTGTPAAGRTALGATAFGSSMFTAADANAGAALLSYPGRLINVRVFTTPGAGTYTPTPGTNSIILDLVGAGGGSAGSAATGAGQYSVGPAGGTGGRVLHRMTSGFAGAAYNVGAGGAAGAVGGNGGAGGSTSWPGLLAVGGGQGFTVGSAAANVAGPGTPGSGAGGNIANIGGEQGAICLWSFFSQIPLATPPSASGPYGAGAPGRGSTGNATPGTGFGVSGGWCMSLPSGVGWAGVAGQGGIIIVYEYA